jgi:hypothetical protein
LQQQPNVGLANPIFALKKPLASTWQNLPSEAISFKFSATGVIDHPYTRKHLPDGNGRVNTNNEFHEMSELQSCLPWFSTKESRLFKWTQKLTSCWPLRNWDQEVCPGTKNIADINFPENAMF